VLPPTIRELILVQFLTSLSAVLDKAAAYAEAKKIDPAMLLNAPLYPTCFPGVAAALTPAMSGEPIAPAWASGRVPASAPRLVVHTSPSREARCTDSTSPDLCRKVLDGF
jgi:hypothetical protein